MTTDQPSPSLMSIRIRVGQLTTQLREIEQNLDALSQTATAPELATGGAAPAPSTGALVSHSTAHIATRGFRIGSHFHPCWTNKAVYLGVLRHLWRSRSSRREEMARASRMGARTRRYLALSRDQLFSGRPVDWSRMHSSPIADGWYADTNLSAERMRVILRRVIYAADLSTDSCIDVEWIPRNGQRQGPLPGLRP